MEKNFLDLRALDVLAGKARPIGRDERRIALLGDLLREDPAGKPAGLSLAGRLSPARPRPPEPTLPLPLSAAEDSLFPVDDSLLGDLEVPFTAEEMQAQQDAMRAALQQHFELEVLAGRMVPTDEATQQVSRLRALLVDDEPEISEEAHSIAEAELDLPPYMPDLFSTESEEIRAQTMANTINYIRYPTPKSDEILHVRRQKSLFGSADRLGMDFAFSQEKVSRGIYILVSADWSEEEIRHPLAANHSFMAAQPRPVMDIATGLVQTLVRDALAYPGKHALEISIVATMAERRREKRSSIPRLRVKAQRADLVFADLTAGSRIGAQASDFEIGMLSMSEAFEQRSLLMCQYDRRGSNVFPDDKIMPFGPDSFFEPERALRPFRDALAKGDDERFKKLTSSLRQENPLFWILPMYLKMRMLAISRGMISGDQLSRTAISKHLSALGNQSLPDRLNEERMNDYRLPAAMFED